MVNQIKVYEEFRQEVVEQLKNRLGGVEIIDHSVTKNNGSVHDGIIIKSMDSNIQPIIYLDHFYDRYKDPDVDMCDIVEEIIESYRSGMDDMIAKQDYSNVLDFQYVKDKIIPVLVNREKNKDMLENCVHKNFLGDLAVYYKIRINDNAHITVTNMIFSNYTVTEDVLYETAINNVKDTYICENMIDLLMEMMDINPEDKEMMEEMKACMPVEERMYAVSNRKRLFGATVMLNEEYMAALSEKYGDIYIIPSSIHEILFISATGDEEQDMFLRGTIQNVNETVLDKEEYLSDHAYLYRKGIGFID